MYLVTGSAGFIGYHVAERLLQQGESVVGLDNLSPYYDVSLKEARLAMLRKHGNFSFVRLDLADRERMEKLFAAHNFDSVIHLAAQAGVRYSVENPFAYVDSNVCGFATVLEGCRHAGVKHLVFASSSSVYGANRRMPFSVHDTTDHQVSLYGATKKANEVMAHAYAHLYGLPCTGLRFFTVYGPWGRPDMSPMLFAKAILEGTPIQLFNNGEHKRDFTYVTDIVEGVVRIASVVPAAGRSPQSGKAGPADSEAPYRIYNIGNSCPVKLMDYVALLETALGKPAVKQFLPLQPGDVPETYADVSDLTAATGFTPSTSIEEGIRLFAEWYLAYHESHAAAVR